MFAKKDSQYVILLVRPVLRQKAPLFVFGTTRLQVTSAIRVTVSGFENSFLHGIHLASRLLPNHSDGDEKHPEYYIISSPFLSSNFQWSFSSYFNSNL